MPGLDGFHIDGATLWLVAAALYLRDTTHRVHGEEIVFTSLFGRIEARATAGWFGAFGARYHLPRPLGGIQVNVYLPAGSGSTAADTGAARRLRAALSELRAFRLLSAFVLALVFAGVPLAAEAFGLPRALLFVLPVVIAINVAQAALLIGRRRRLGLDRGAAWSMVSDIVLCPPYGANVAGRLAGRWRDATDGVALALAVAPDDALREIVLPRLAGHDLGAAERAAFEAIAARHEASPGNAP